jgi:hypothetical protein
VLTAVLRGAEVANPLEVAVGFLEKWAYEADVDASPMSFEEADLRRANRGGARISAAEIAAILERRREIERSLRAIPADSSLAARSIPWAPLTRLFDAFAEIRGVGFSKMTKALHKKRPALIPMLDSIVQTYLAADAAGGSFGERATALVRGYKVDLDRNRVVLRAVRRELARRGYDVTEVRLLDLMIWSAFA